MDDAEAALVVGHVHCEPELEERFVRAEGEVQALDLEQGEDFGGDVGAPFYHCEPAEAGDPADFGFCCFFFFGGFSDPFLRPIFQFCFVESPARITDTEPPVAVEWKSAQSGGRVCVGVREHPGCQARVHYRVVRAGG